MQALIFADGQRPLRRGLRRHGPPARAGRRDDRLRLHARGVPGVGRDALDAPAARRAGARGRSETPLGMASRGERRDEPVLPARRLHAAGRCAASATGSAGARSRSSRYDGDQAESAAPAPATGLARRQRALSPPRARRRRRPRRPRASGPSSAPAARSPRSRRGRRHGGRRDARSGGSARRRRRPAGRAQVRSDRSGSATVTGTSSSSSTVRRVMREAAVPRARIAGGHPRAEHDRAAERRGGVHAVERGHPAVAERRSRADDARPWAADDRVEALLRELVLNRPGGRDRLLLSPVRRCRRHEAGEQRALAQLAHDARVPARERAAGRLDEAEPPAAGLRERPAQRRELAVKRDHGDRRRERRESRPRPRPAARRAAASCS